MRRGLRPLKLFYALLSLQVVNNNQHFLCKLQDNDTLRSYEMTAIFQEKTIVNFPMCYFLAKLENTLRYLEVMYTTTEIYLMCTCTVYIFIIPCC